MKAYLHWTATILMCPLLLATACTKEEAAPTPGSTSVPAADNTKMNAVDKGSTITPMDQGNNAADLDTTQQIRKAIMTDDSLSGNAKEVKVVTANGVITLRGPVKDDAQHQTILAKAKKLAGTNRVDDHIDVEAPK